MPAYAVEDMQVRQHDAYAHAKYQILLHWLGQSATTSQRILNVGCGSGELSILLAQRGHSVLGIDPVEEYVSFAATQAKLQNLPNCSFVAADLDTIHADVAQPKYDAVFCTDVVEHLADDVRAIQQLASLLKPGGELFITVPGGPYLYGHHDEQLGHFRRYSLRQLAGVFPENLAIQEIRYFGFSLIPVAWLYSQVLRRAYPVSKTGNKKTNPVLARTVSFVLLVEERIRPPLGTSCLVWAKKSVMDQIDPG